MQKNKTRVGIIGCGMIFDRHVEAIKLNNDYFELVAVCDILSEKQKVRSIEFGVPGFEDYKKMLKDMSGKMDMVAICTPNSLHFTQAIDSLHAGYNVLIEKPIDFSHKRVIEISDIAKKQGRRAYSVLQVRYNPTISLIRKALNENIVGDIRSVSLIQRWQRPSTYFDSWRADIKVGGRTLYEVGIHYLDILQMLFGVPTILSSATFNNKHKHVAFEDTVFGILKYPDHSGSIEVTIAAEPKNLECSISIMGSEGYIKVGGRALDEVETALFSNSFSEAKWSKILSSTGKSLEPNSYGTHAGSCPNHPTLYREIAQGRGIDILESVNSIKFIEDIYNHEIK